MHRPTIALIACAVVSSSVFVALAQTKAPAAQSQSEMKKQFAALTEKSSAPTEEHKLLAAFVGEFEQAVEVQMGASEPMRVRSIAKGEWILGGRFVKVESASAADEELKGERMTVYGFDPESKQFTLWTIESSNPIAVTAEGNFDAATKTFTLNGERPQPGAGRVPFRWVVHVKDNGSLAQEIQIKSPGAQTFTRVVALEQTRKQK